MKYILLFVFSVPILFSIQSIGQSAVIDVSELINNPGVHYLPDVDGKLLVQEDFIPESIYPGWLSGITLFPDWPLSYSGSSSRGGIYCNLDEDDELEIIYCVSQEVYAWNTDGSIVDGWPVSVSLFPDGAPAFGDIDGDGEGEIVVSSRQAGTGNTGSLSAFHKDGSTVDGFPVTLGGGATKTPVLADLNGDGVHEILIEERDWPDGYLGVYSGDGTVYPGFPVLLDYIPASAVAVGDITGDNVPEIVAESYYSIYAFDNEGNVLDGFPFTPGNERVFSYSSPVLADLDGDGLREILVGDHAISAGNGAVHVLKNDGSALEGWPQYTSYWIYGPPAVGDINGDGELDVAVGDQVLAGTPSNRVYAWDQEGNELPGWPTDFINSINNQIILADLDGDDEIELMWDDNTGANVYMGYNHDGTPMEGWPLGLNGSSFFMNPFIADLNNDGTLDISGASVIISNYDLDFYVWDAGVDYNADLAPLSILQYNVRHDGNYVDESVLNAGFIASTVEMCEGTEVQFTDQSTGDVTSWDWSFEGGYPSNSVEANPIVYYGESGEYEVSLSVSDGSSSSTITIDDFLFVEYEAVIPDQPLGPTLFSTDTANITYYETFAPNASEYVWELSPEGLGAVVPGDTITQVKIYWSNDPNYSAELKVKAVNVCGESEFSESLTIYVNWSVGIGVEKANNPFRIYPNPSDGLIRVDLLAMDEGGMISIYTIQGEIIQEVQLHDQVETMKISDLPSGIYMLSLEMQNKVFSEKFVVR